MPSYLIISFLHIFRGIFFTFMHIFRGYFKQNAIFFEDIFDSTCYIFSIYSVIW